MSCEEELRVIRDSLQEQMRLLEHRVHDLEEVDDTFVLTPWWKRIWFAIDGWPLHKIVERRQWRPWHK